jgi:MFS family permease
MGPAAGAFVGGIVLINFGWRWLFGVFGLGALVWLPIWYWAMPKEMPVAAHGAPEPANEDGNARTTDPSTLSILRLPAAWGSIIGQFCGNYFYYFLLAWLPSYLMQEEKFSIPEMSKLTSGVFFLIACTTLVCGYISDIWIASGSSPSVVRRTFSAGGLVLASLLIPFSLVRGHWSLVLLGLASMGQGAYASNHWAITQTLAGPKMAGRWSSLQNGFANFAGVAAPWLSGFIIQRFGSARLAFTVAGLVAGTGGVLFGLLVRRVEVVDWDALARGGRTS